MQTQVASFEIEDRKTYLLVRCAENTPLTVKLVSEMMQEQMRIDKGRNLDDLWDLRLAADSDDLNYQGIKMVVDQARAVREGKWHRKTAILVGEDFRYGLARMYKSLAVDLPMEVEIFSDIRQAEQWLSGGERE